MNPAIPWYELKEIFMNHLPLIQKNVNKKILTYLKLHQFHRQTSVMDETLVKVSSFLFIFPKQ